MLAEEMVRCAPGGGDFVPPSIFIALKAQKKYKRILDNERDSLPLERRRWNHEHRNQEIRLPVRLPRHLRHPGAGRSGSGRRGKGRPAAPVFPRHPLPEDAALRKKRPLASEAHHPPAENGPQGVGRVHPGLLGPGDRNHSGALARHHRNVRGAGHPPLLLRRDHGGGPEKRRTPVLPPAGRLPAGPDHLLPGQGGGLAGGHGAHPDTAPGRSRQERPFDTVGHQRGRHQHPLPERGKGGEKKRRRGLAHRHLRDTDCGGRGPDLPGAPGKRRGAGARHHAPPGARRPHRRPLHRRTGAGLRRAAKGRAAGIHPGRVLAPHRARG